jgi:hypothetical protein
VAAVTGQFAVRSDMGTAETAHEIRVAIPSNQTGNLVPRNGVSLRKLRGFAAT